MGGTKRKIEIVEIKNKSAKTVTLTKRRRGLFSRAAELCLLSPASQIAILTTPLSSKPHASFYSFGHSSVDHLVFSLLNNTYPIPTGQENKSGLGFWWEDESFDRSENIYELKEATDAISRMLNNVRLQLDAVEHKQRDEDLVIHQGEKVLQLHNTETNNNEETANQVIKFEGASGSGCLVANEDNLHIDDFFADVKIDPLF